MGAAGVSYLDSGRIDGDDPLRPFGARTADQLRRLDGFAHVGDLLVNSVYYQELDEVAAFEELVGSHGGFGGPQVRPFILAPVDLPFDGAPVVGAPAVHKLLVRWADSLGVGPQSGATDAPLTEAATSAKAPGIKVIAVLTALTALLWVLIGVLLVVGGELVGGDEYVIAGVVLVVLAIFGLFVSIGLWRRRNWARVAAIAWYAIGVLQALAALGSAGLEGLLAAGLIPVAVSVLVFFYLTRPHVAAAFRAGTRAGQDRELPA
jgi:hypothetical protein